MEEKNTSKISLSTVFLILAIIVILVMGIFIYKLNNDKTAEIKKSTDLQAQVNNLNGTISELQGKIDSISQTINSNNTTNNEDSINANNTNTIAANQDNSTNNIEKAVKLSVGTFSVKNITDDELNDSVIGWINILENNKFELPRIWRYGRIYWNIYN